MSEPSTISHEEMEERRHVVVMEGLDGIRAQVRSLKTEYDALVAERDALKGALTTIRQTVDEQAEDEGLWSLPLIEGTQPIMEAYLQQELRRLHAAIEGVYPQKSPES